MSLCFLKTSVSKLAIGRLPYTKLPLARLIHRQNESFSSLWSTPANFILNHLTATPVKPASKYHSLHQLHHNSPVASTCSCHTFPFRKCTTSDQILKKAICNVLIRNMSNGRSDDDDDDDISDESKMIPNDKKLKIDDLVKLIEKKEVMLVDVRNRDEVKTNGAIPSSLNIPVSELATALKAPDEIFKNKYGFNKPKPDDPIVFFCATGRRSYRALRAVLLMGFENFSTSTSLCQVTGSGRIGPDKHLSYDDLVELMIRKEIYLIDVREPHELAETGELPGSVNIPMTELNSALKELSESDFQKKYKAKKPDMTAPLVFSCRSGVRSLNALQTALDLGYMKAKHYKGGFLDWEEHTKSESL